MTTPDNGLDLEALVKVAEAGPWLREDRTVYALQSAGFRRGEEQFQNRWSLHVQGGVGSTPDELLAVAALVQATPALIAQRAALVEALKLACEEIKDLRNNANNHGGMIDEENFVEGLAALKLAGVDL